MPLTGYSNKYEKKRGVTVSIDSIGGGGPGYFPPVAQKQEIAQTSAKPTSNVDNNNNNCNNNTQAVEQSGYSNNSSALSTEDFLALHNSSQSKSAPVEAMEVVKDVMALKMLEKVLETINDIMK